MSRTLVRLFWWMTVTVCLVSSMTSFAQDHATIKSYPNGAFALGWTHIVSTPGGILDHNVETGAGAFGTLDGAGGHNDDQDLCVGRIRNRVDTHCQHAGRHPVLQRGDGRRRDRQV